MPDDDGVPSSVLTLAEAASFIRVSTKTLREMARQKRIPSQKVGREWRFLRRALEDWLSGGDASRAAEAAPSYDQRAMFEPATPSEETPDRLGFGDTAFTRSRREPLHRWVPWVAGFSAGFVERALDHVASDSPADVTVRSARPFTTR